MLNADKMSPDASPGVSWKSGVRRANNLPIYLIGGGLAVFLGVMAMVAYDRAAQQDLPLGQKARGKSGNTTTMAKEIAGSQTGGFIPPERAARPTVPTDNDGPGLPTARADLDTPPTPPGGGAPAGPRDPLEEERNRIRLARLARLEDAARAKTVVPMVQLRGRDASQGPAGAGVPSREEMLARLAAVKQQIDAQGSGDPGAAYKARVAQLQASGLFPGGGSAAGSTTEPPRPGQQAGQGGPRNDLGQFAGPAMGDRWALQSNPQAPRTPFELRAGFVIPATLISGINSELPGQVMAQVSQDVYDTATGAHKLVPQGSRLVGQYSSDIGYGQSRLFIAWQRVIFPDGKALDIGSMPGADGAGYGGLSDQVNNHFVRILGSALLMSGVTAGVAISQTRNVISGVGTAPTASTELSAALGQQLGQVTAQMISKNMNIAPTLEIRPGFRFNVMVVKDLTFSKPYQAFDY